MAHWRRAQRVPDAKGYLSGDQHPGRGDHLDLPWTARKGKWQNASPLYQNGHQPLIRRGMAQPLII
jgi:hypothetical protein